MKLFELDEADLSEAGIHLADYRSQANPFYSDRTRLIILVERIGEIYDRARARAIRESVE